MISYVLVLGFSTVGLVSSGKYVESLFIIYALFAIQTVTSMIYTSGTRYRGVLEPLMIVLAAQGIVWALHKLRTNHIIRG